MKKFLLIFIISVSCLMGQSKIGSSSAPFLNIAIGPRAVSMGGAFIATASDVTALYWNPAGASRSETNEAMFSYSKWFADINYNWGGAMLNLGGAGTIGLSVTYLDYGDIEVTTLAEQDGTGQFFSASDMSLALTYAYNLTDRFSIGGNVKYIQQKDINGLRIGATISNFGAGMSMDGKDLLVQHDIDPNSSGNNDQILAKLQTDEFPLPLTFKIGLAMDLINSEDHTFTLAADAIHPNDNSESLNVGAEYLFFNIIAFRVGYKSLFLDNTEEGFTAGVGLNYHFTTDLGIRFDYAYQNFGILDNTQHFSLGIKF